MTERFLEENCAPEQLSPLTLAFVGDGVYDLMVRERLVCQANRQAGKLHKLAVEQVKCQAQAQRMEKILPLLTEEEQSVYIRRKTRLVLITTAPPAWRRCSVIYT